MKCLRTQGTWLKVRLMFLRLWLFAVAVLEEELVVLP